MDILHIKCKLLNRPWILRIGIIKSLATHRERRERRKERERSICSLCILCNWKYSEDI